MRWRAAVIATLLAALVLPASGTARRYVLVSDDWGAYDDCTGDYDHTSWMLVSAAPGAIVARGLDPSIDFAAFPDGGAGVVWQAGRQVEYGDLRSGGVRSLATLARGAELANIAIGAHGRSAIISADDSHVVLVGHRGGRIVRHTFRANYADNSALGLSSDGRFGWYTTRDSNVKAVRALSTGRGMLLRTDEIAWAPAGDGLAYVQGDQLLVLDMRTQRQVLTMSLPSEFGLGQPAWSPDGRFIALDKFVVDVTAQQVVALPEGGDPLGWRPRHGHQLERLDEHGDGDLLDAALATVLWRQPRLERFAWDPSGRWLVGDGKLLTATGRRVRVPRAFATLWNISSTSWLAAGQLWFGGRRNLRVAAPPHWHPRTVLTAPAGHHVTASVAFQASPAGAAMLERRFAGRAHASDCVL
jgi:hypothetical protein